MTTVNYEVIIACQDEEHRLAAQNSLVLLADQKCIVEHSESGGPLRGTHDLHSISLKVTLANRAEAEDMRKRLQNEALHHGPATVRLIN